MFPITRLLALVSFALVPLVSHAVPVSYSALLSGANEVPPNASQGSGSVLVVYDSSTHVLNLDVTFTGLTVPATAAHIHAPAAPGVNAPVAVPMPSFPTATSGTYSRTFDLTQASSFNAAFVTNNGGTAAGAEAALASHLASGLAYFNIHNTVYPGGEIRGNLASVPDGGATALLFAPALLALAALSRRRQRV